MKKLLKKIVFYSVMTLIIPIYCIGMTLLFIAALVTGFMCDHMED